MPDSPLEAPRIRREEFLRIQRIAHERFGLWLRDGKEELVRTRLTRELRRLGVTDFRAYANLLEADTTGDLEERFTNLLTTNHTHFFREAEHFAYLESAVLPQIAHRAQFRVWCAACATGEEAYTLAFCILRFLTAQRGRMPDARGTGPLVEATDISTRALANAAAGIYDESRFHHVSPASLRSYLLKGSGERAGTFRIRPEVRALVRFSPINLLRAWPFTEPFPAIFCRNVMIYFDRETQTRLVRRMTAQLEPGGYLFVGHSESLNGMDHGLTYVQPAVYRKAGTLSPDGPPDSRRTGSRSDARDDSQEARASRCRSKSW